MNELSYTEDEFLQADEEQRVQIPIRLYKLDLRSLEVLAQSRVIDYRGMQSNLLNESKNKFDDSKLSMSWSYIYPTNQVSIFDQRDTVVIYDGETLQQMQRLVNPDYKIFYSSPAHDKIYAVSVQDDLIHEINPHTL